MFQESHQSGEDDVSLTTQSRTYTIDFHLMQQINDDTGTTRPVKRIFNSVLLANSVGIVETPADISNESGINNNQNEIDLKFVYV